VADLSMFIVVAHPDDQAPLLRCDDHPDWWADADAERLPTVIERAVAHFRDEHRVHVADCVCRDRVTDGRCLPHLNIAGSDG
jgi:hypothetical protein